MLVRPPQIRPTEQICINFSSVGGRFIITSLTQGTPCNLLTALFNGQFSVWMPIFTWRVNLTIEPPRLRSGMEFFDLLCRVCVFRRRSALLVWRGIFCGNFSPSFWWKALWQYYPCLRWFYAFIRLSKMTKVEISSLISATFKNVLELDDQKERKFVSCISFQITGYDILKNLRISEDKCFFKS